MSNKQTLAWGPSARKDKPHAFVPDTERNPRWCDECGYVEDAYQHATEQERHDFDNYVATQPMPRLFTGKGITQTEYDNLLEELGNALNSINTAGGRRNHPQFLALYHEIANLRGDINDAAIITWRTGL